MAGIRDISQIYNSTNRRITGKISFKIGDNFAAKILSRSEDGKGIVLRTIDGWQFPAILEEPIEMLPELLVKFQVLGYDNGEVKLKLIPKELDEKTNEEKSLLEIAKSNNLEEEDMDLLKSMTTFSIPLERENISKVKTLVDFLKKINKDPDEIEQFISKYLKGNQISSESKEGREIANSLRNFFEEFKEMPLEEILLFQENGIELTEDNIKSYKDIFEKPQGMKNSLETITNTINNFVKESSTNKKIDFNGLTKEQLFVDEGISEEFLQLYYNDVEVEPEIYENHNYNYEDSYKDTSVNTTNNKLEFDGENKAKPLLSKDFNEKLAQLITEELPIPLKEGEEGVKLLIKEKVVPKVIEKINESMEFKGKVEGEEVVKLIKDNLRKTPELKDVLNEKDLDEIVIKLKDSKDLKELVNLKRNSNTSNVVMDQVKDKIEELKDMVKTIIDAKSELDPKTWNGILNNVKANINDIKMFNTISGEYYYMDVPIKFKEDEYPCKLIIKDDRKKGKKIDSNNVKMAVSVSTVKMGKIDIYLNLKERNMKLDFKCEEQWVKVLDMAKEKLYKILDHNNYNISIKVSEREMEMNLTNCREFFQDAHNSNINVVV